MGQSASAPKVISVDFEGLSRTSPAFAQDVSGIRPGDSFDPTVLEESVGKLLATRRYSKVEFSTVRTDEGVRVTFVLRERTILSNFRFKGNTRFRDGQLRTASGLKIGDAVDELAIRDARDAVAAKYKEAGFSSVQVHTDVSHLEEAGELLLIIDEGRRVRVTQIDFEGNSFADDADLRKQIETKKAIWILRKGVFEAETAEADVAKIRTHYRNAGFLDAKTKYESREEPDGVSISVVFHVEEGERYRIESLRLEGNAVLLSDEIAARMKSKEGDFVNLPALEADVQMIQTQYGEIGYIDSDVRPIRLFADQPGMVRITIKIEEGTQFRVGRVAVRGNAQTKDKVVRRALNLYPPDDLLNLTEAKEAEKRLVDTRIFTSAKVTPVGDDPSSRDVVIDVVEADRMGNVIFGAGVTSNSGLVGQIGLELLNFDLFDTPRTWSEFFRFRAFSGAGQRLRLEMQPGTEFSRFSLDFTEPYLWDRAVRFDTSLFYFERDRDGYNETRVGSTVSFGKRFERGRFRGWSGELSFRVENVEIDSLDLFVARDIRRVKGSNFLTGIKSSVVRDRTDNRLLPSTGDRLRIAYEQVGALGGDHDFGKATAAYSYFLTLHTDALDRKGVLQFRTEGGVLVGDAPVFERFYAGGIGSIRGFQFRGVGPREGIRKNNVGGDFLALAGSEYSFPLYGESLRGLFFVDSGTVGSGAWRAGFGTGIRFTLNFITPLPIEFSVAWPVSRDEDDEDQFFGFTIGNIF